MTTKYFDVYKLRINNFIRSNYKSLIYVFGFIVIAFWSLYRFFIKLSTYDLVGQQLLTRQWLSGFHSNALIGTTNYILKMIFIYTPFNYLPGSPLLKIELMTLIINIATFIISIYFIKKIYMLFFGDFKKSSYLSMLYFAGLAGSMYWIEFANSRNLEFAFGLGLIFLILSSIEYFSYKKLASILVLSTLLFFSDPLQIYMSMVPSVLYLILINLKTIKSIYKKILAVLITLIVSYAAYLLLLKVAMKTFGLNIIDMGTHAAYHGNITNIIKGIIPGIKQMFRLYVGGHEYGFIVEGLYLLFAASIIAAFLVSYFKDKKSRKFILFMAIFFSVDFAFYVASGQSKDIQTSRYLIMTVGIFIVGASYVLSLKSKYVAYIKYLLVFLALLSVFKIGFLTVSAYPTRYSQESHNLQVVSYLENSKFNYGLSSMDVSIPSDYFSDGRVRLLPLNCVSGAIVVPNLFFDMGYYRHALTLWQENTPIFLNGDTLRNGLNVCDKASLVQIFGQPIDSQKLSDGSTILLFPAQNVIKGLGL